jgi:glucoamylase
MGYWLPTCDTLPKPCLQSQKTIGRAWPIFAGERGEYELLSGGPASQRLSSIAKTGNAGYMLPEQV